MHKEQDEVQKISIGVWKKIFSIIKNLKSKVLILIIFAVIMALLDSLVNVINVYAINNFIETANYSKLPGFIVFNIAFAVTFGLIVWGFIRKAIEIEASVNYQIRKEAFENLQRLSFNYFDKTPQGWIMARMTSDAKRLSNIISWTVLDFFWSILFMIFTLIILFIYNVQLAFIVLLSVPIMFLVAVVFRKKILNAHRKSRKYNSIATAKYSEAFLGAKTTKTLVIEETNLLEFDEITDNLKRHTVRAISISSLFSSILLMITYLILGVIMYQGTILSIEKAIEISTLFLFLRATVNFFDPVMMLTNIMSNVQQAQASAERIVELIETEPEIKDSDLVIEQYGTQLAPIKDNYFNILGDVEFKNVSFHYLENEDVLTNFNLKVKAGSKVALVGHTGSGKTTIVNLLARFYEPISGEILIDNLNYKDLSINLLHSQLGYVLQSPHLFSTTIKENIKYGKLDATDLEVENAAKLVGLDHFVNTLDKKYDTHVGEGGNLLSLGQKQLISFARALINDPKILILDEATSSIDSESELLIEKATKTVLENRTSFVVAHRLSTIKDSDLIVMLDSGFIIEMGTHEELINNKNKYYELYKSQFIEENMNRHLK